MKHTKCTKTALTSIVMYCHLSEVSPQFPHFSLIGSKFKTLLEKKHTEKHVQPISTQHFNNKAFSTASLIKETKLQYYISPALACWLPSDTSGSRYLVVLHW